MKKIFSNFRVNYLIIELLGFVLLTLLVIKSSKDLKPPIITGEEAINTASIYLAAQALVIDASHPTAFFSRGMWLVIFFTNSYTRPSTILIKVNPITGNAERIPLK